MGKQRAKKENTYLRIWASTPVSCPSAKRNLISVLLILSFLIADQISKQLAMLSISPGTSVPLVKKCLYLTPVKNQGTFLGLLPGLFYPAVLLSFLVITVLTCFLMVRAKKKSRLGISFIIAGTAGNLMDRIFRGGVVDFINIGFWPVFNLADVFIAAGAVLISAALLRMRKKCTE